MTYTVTARSRQDENSIKTQNTFYEFKDLFCDEEYDIIISSESETCNSLGNSSLHVKTIPCPPRILEAYASCENNSGFIQWDISHNARSYKAVAEGVNRLSCNTTDTSCEIPKLECGQNYTVTVWAEDGICTGQSSPNVTFKTVPCVVQNITSTVMCQDNALHVSWNVSSGATAYSATAVGTQGDIVIADTPDPNCLLSPLQCGEVYSLTVLAMNDECKSSESAAMKIISAPCSPMHLTASSDCEIKGASASWERSVGAVSYIAVFHGPDGDDVSCTSTSTSCSVSGLHCGQAYNVTVTAFDGSCHSVTTNTTIVTTVPCTPTNIEASINCSAMDIMNVTWSPSRGAESYVVLAKGHDGHTLSCNTTTDTCIINAVHCGDNYTISVTAWNTDCSSDTVTIEAVETVPCTPDLVEVEIDCLTHEALVSWQEHNIHPSYHTAVTSDPLGMEHSCSTFLSSCHISGLECGLEYNFQVYSTNSQCSSLKSVVYKSMTAPCEPKDITASVHCENSDALITWTKTRGAVYYMATLSGIGTSLSCNATDTNCSYFGLQCGQTYNASVVAMDGKCTSGPSTISTFKTAPCQPQGLNIGLDCSSQTASMSWDESDGAQLYNVLIESLNGTVSSYTTSHISFSSDVLPCGHTYGFTVMALGGTCNSSRSLTLYENSAPCTPMNVTYTKNCPTTMAFVTWSESEGAIDYHLTAIESGGMQTYCNSTNSTCWLMDLKCGLSYYVEVVAVGQRCSSNTSSLVLLDTAPCLPKNAAVHMECENSSATFSWERSRGALGYLAMVKKNEDFVYSCDTIETNCTAPDLSCGDSYSFSVLATDMQCNSSFTTPIVSGVVPCPPIEVETSIYRGSVKPQEVEISWNGSHCGTNYMATVQGQIGYDPEASFILNSYWTSYMDFYIPVPCSSSYNVTVTAQNLAGASDPTTPIAGYTAPCPPQVTPLVIKDGTILISWEQTPYADEYRVVEIDNNNIVCTTPGLSCNVPITASSFQVIAVNPAGESTPTFVSGYNGVSSK
ncbi:fibronectin type III domain-containing protein 7-like [Mixophyes fleayi]|uniref:fibronectin type III domain-containing protein 7-like n=1 Tax=Mixophyes fleayi TaxID=3061075 RepID=UPI003F4E1E4B